MRVVMRLMRIDIRAPCALSCASSNVNNFSALIFNNQQYQCTLSQLNFFDYKWVCFVSATAHMLNQIENRRNKSFSVYTFMQFRSVNWRQGAPRKKCNLQYLFQL